MSDNRKTNLGLLPAAHPDRSNAAAIVSNPDDLPAEPISYAELESACAAVACHLHANFPQGSRVAIVGENSVNYLLVVLAAARAGLVAVPMSPRQGAAQISEVLAQAQPRIVFADDECRDLVGSDYLLAPLTRDSLGQLAGPDFTPSAGGAEIALQLYTSGSSGRPKGVLLSHQALMFTLQGYFDAPAASWLQVLVAAPLFHLNGLMTCLTTLAQGGTILLLNRFEPNRYLRAIELGRPTVLVGVPTMFAMVLDALPGHGPLRLDSVLAIVSGSAPLSDEHREEISAAFPAAQVHNSYGTTEAFGMFGPHPQGLVMPAGSVGACQPGVEVRLVDGPSPSEGRLLVRTPASMSGYQGADAATGSRPGEGWYDTGDLVRVDEDGFFFVAGRADDLINCGGEKVFPAAVEAILQAHPTVRSAAVVAVADSRKGQVPVAFVVSVTGAMADPVELKQHALEHGPAYAHPRRIVVLEELPTTGPGKVDKRRLQADAAAYRAEERGNAR